VTNESLAARASEAVNGGPLNRRVMLTAGGVAGASTVALLVASCSSGAPAPAAPASGTPTSPSPSAPTTVALSASTPSSSAAPTGTALGPASAVPVGGGTIYAQEQVVVTQPTAGTFKAFSAICTHEGCTVSSVSGGTINCPCHGSKFKIADGSVAHGPAQRPLPAKQITDDDGTLRFS
jgi:Rieske Fe-S protein